MIRMFAVAATVAAFVADFPATGRVISGPRPQVELKNTGDRPITAWSFAVVSPTATGTHRETHTADVYLSEVTHGLPQSEAHLDWLRPNESRTLPIDSAPPGASVQFVALVFDDGTSVGDPETIGSFFAHRAAERDELKKVVDAFNAALQTKRGAAALEDLQKRFAPSGGEESVPRRSARDAVATWLQRGNAVSDDDLDRSARTYLAFVTKQYEAAVRHSRPL